jgi:pimeloyl-ACP methyl ester carboxylesterase
MPKFTRENYAVDGVQTAVYSAGHGEPLVFFHGAGTAAEVAGKFDTLEPWTEKFRVIIPFHPGFGESGDDPTFTDLHDYVMHYLELFDILKLDRFHLVGLSLGGYLAAKFASEHGHRVKKLGLIAPAGMIDPHHPMIDFLAVPGDQVVGLLVSNFDVLKPYLPEKPDLDFIGERYREAGTVARLWWERPGDPKFLRYLHRVKNPTLIVWGEEDKLIPVQQAETWRKFIPNADIKIFKGAGHLVHMERPEAIEALAKFLA